MAAIWKSRAAPSAPEIGRQRQVAGEDDGRVGGDSTVQTRPCQGALMKDDLCRDVHYLELRWGEPAIE